jgi:hypothetical protein
MLFASAEQHWAVELKRAKQKGSAPDLIRGVWLPSSPAALWMTIVLSVVSGLCNTVARPLLLRWTLLAIQDPDKYAMEAGMGFAAGLVVVLWIESWTRNYAVMEGSAIATARMMAGTMHLVGLKALHVAIGEGKASADASASAATMAAMAHRDLGRLFAQCLRMHLADGGASAAWASAPCSSTTSTSTSSGGRWRPSQLLQPHCWCRS